MKLSGVFEFFERLLFGVGREKKRAGSVIYFNVSVYIFESAVHLAHPLSFVVHSIAKGKYDKRYLVYEFVNLLFKRFADLRWVYNAYIAFQTEHP